MNPCGSDIHLIHNSTNAFGFFQHFIMQSNLPLQSSITYFAFSLLSGIVSPIYSISLCTFNNHMHYPLILSSSPPLIFLLNVSSRRAKFISSKWSLPVKDTLIIHLYFMNSFLLRSLENIFVRAFSKLYKYLNYALHVWKYSYMKRIKIKHYRFFAFSNAWYLTSFLVFQFLFLNTFLKTFCRNFRVRMSHVTSNWTFLTVTSYPPCSRKNTLSITNVSNTQVVEFE